MKRSRVLVEAAAAQQRREKEKQTGKEKDSYPLVDLPNGTAHSAHVANGEEGNNPQHSKALKLSHNPSSYPDSSSSSTSSPPSSSSPLYPLPSTVTLSPASFGAIIRDKGLSYIPGFGGHFETERLPHTLPLDQSNPQFCSRSLYAELLSGSTFTTPRNFNLRSWMYRVAPTAKHKPFVEITEKEGKEPMSVNVHGIISDFSAGPHVHVTPQQTRWTPFTHRTWEENKVSIDFLQGLHTIGGVGSPDVKNGLSISVFLFNASMVGKSCVNADGDYLFVPQQGNIRVRSENGLLHIHPGEIAVIPRAIAFSIEVWDGNDEEGEEQGKPSPYPPKALPLTPVRGYLLEVYNGHFRLPELGPIGSNGLAAPRDFLHPVASFIDPQGWKGPWTHIHKFQGKFFSIQRPTTPFDVVGWHGNYSPYKYDLNKFIPAGAVRLDHLDPSIFTVLSCPSTEPGVAICDFVIFPPRWAVQEHTFRIPYYHRNVASEFMGNIYGHYEAKPTGFLPGGASLHSIGSGHGPDAEAYSANTQKGVLLPPQRLSDHSMSFMFESNLFYKLTDFGLKNRDEDYWKSWMRLQNNFFSDQDGNGIGNATQDKEKEKKSGATKK